MLTLARGVLLYIGTRGNPSPKNVKILNNHLNVGVRNTSSLTPSRFNGSRRNGCRRLDGSSRLDGCWSHEESRRWDGRFDGCLIRDGSRTPTPVLRWT